MSSSLGCVRRPALLSTHRRVDAHLPGVTPTATNPIAAPAPRCQVQHSPLGELPL
jgi:hypothetical protein